MGVNTPPGLPEETEAVVARHFAEQQQQRELHGERAVQIPFSGS